MDVRAQGGGETHTGERCGEVLPTEQELERHMRAEHGGDATEPRQAIAGVSGE